MKHYLYLIILATLILLPGCGKKTADNSMTGEDSIAATILKVQDCARLYTSEIQIHKIVTFDDVSRLKGSFFSRSFDLKLPLGSRKVAIPIDATLKASIDFSQFSRGNIRVDSTGGRRKLTVILPDPQLIVTASKVDNASMKEYVSWLRSNFSDAELTNFTRQGIDAVTKSIPQLGLVEQCRLQATRVLLPLFLQMGYREEDVTLVFRKDVTDTSLPILNKIID